MRLPDARVMLALLLLGAAPVDRCRGLRSLSRRGLEVSATNDGAMCRVEGVARPRPAAAIRFELWLPPATRWSGRYYQMGNGGFAGHIDRPTLAAAAARGDAAAATDTGHTGDGFDARWAKGRPDLVADYAWRSIKATYDAARAVTRRYYGRGARRHYFMGCSYGGRQALVAASRWPADWDGVIAGAPATRWPERLRAFGQIQRALTTSPIAPDQVEPLIAIARRRCGGRGEGCGVRAAVEGCRRDHTRLCLTPAQAKTIALIEAAGYPLAGGDAEEWRHWILSADPQLPSQAAFATQAVSLASYDAMFKVGDLQAFAARGGRVLSYFGTADAVLPPARAMADATAVGATNEFYRLFLMPRMAHCQGGPGALAFGQSVAAPAAVDDPTHDVRRSLEAWVEHGVAPDRLVALRVDDKRLVIVRPVALRDVSGHDPLGRPRRDYN